MGNADLTPPPPDSSTNALFFERQYRDLLEQIPNGVFIVDVGQGRIVDVNTAACRLVEYSREDLLSRITVADLHPHDLAVFHDLGGKVYETGSGSTEKLSCMTASGRVVPIEVFATRFDDAAGRRLMRLIVTDVRRQRAVEQALEDEIKNLHDYEETVGRSPAWREVLEQVDLVAATDATVLITGETGTGKELVARAVYHHSRRSAKPMIRLNCAAMPAGLVESELFGHEKGAFTGAIALKRGRFELAHEGTMFLDEIGDLPLEVQPKLLRVLQEHEFERVGGQRTLRVDTRLITATHRDLDAMAREGRFRDDLLYRINVFPIHLPPLRDRRTDIPLLAAFFASRFRLRSDHDSAHLSQQAMDRLLGYDWPGNVRELANVVERAVILSRGGPIETEHVLLQSKPVMDAQPSATVESGTLAEAERTHILKTLESTGWKVTGKGGAAEWLDLKPSTLASRMKKLGISRPKLPHTSATSHTAK